jgi:hypothetical protein
LKILIDSILNSIDFIKILQAKRTRKINSLQEKALSIKLESNENNEAIILNNKCFDQNL